MKVSVLRHGDGRAIYAATGAIVGLLLAAAVVWLATMDGGSPEAVRDVLAVALALWALGWVLAPVWGGGPVLRPENFTLLPLRPRTLSAGLLGAALVGIGPAVTTLAFTSLVVYGARLGLIAALLGVWALVAQLLLVVLASLVVGRVRGALEASRPGAAVSGVVTGLMLVLSQSGWVVLVALGAVLETGFSAPVPGILRALPTSWGILAVSDAGAGRWWSAGGWIVAQVLVLGVLFALWTRTVQAAPGRRATITGPDGAHVWAAPRRLPPTFAAVLERELRTWWRDPARVQVLTVAPVFGVLTVAAFLPFGATVLLPWTSALAVIMMVVSTTNPYGQDGTGLWLTLSVPSAPRADIRGRQLAWVLVTAPMAVLLTILAASVYGPSPAWAWATAVMLSLLGAGAGAHVYLGVAFLAPGKDPHREKGGPLDHPDVTGPAFTAFFATLLAPLPALGPLALMGTDPPLWAGVAAGAVVGAGWYFLLGVVAERRLEQTGPELLLTMRTGKAQQPDTTSTLDALPAARQRALWAWIIAGTIALIPQAIVPAVMKLTDSVAPVWFLALHLPQRWQWPTVAAMVVFRGGRLPAGGTPVPPCHAEHGFCQGFWRVTQRHCAQLPQVTTGHGQAMSEAHAPGESDGKLARSICTGRQSRRSTVD